MLYLTWHPEGQAIVEATGFGGNEEITKDTYGDEKGKKDHSCNGETDQCSDTGDRGRRGAVRLKYVKIIQ